DDVHPAPRALFIAAASGAVDGRAAIPGIRRALLRPGRVPGAASAACILCLARAPRSRLGDRGQAEKTILSQGPRVSFLRGYFPSRRRALLVDQPRGPGGGGRDSRRNR